MLTIRNDKVISISGSLEVTGSITGDGSGLTNIPASGITGLNLSQIASGSATAAISPDKGFQVNTNTQITGSLKISGSLIPQGLGSDENVIIGKDAAVITVGGVMDSGQIAIGKGAAANMYSVALGRDATSGVDNISIGYRAGSNFGTNSRGVIAIGSRIKPTTDADNSINFAANDQNVGDFSPTEPKTFGVYLDNGTADSPQLKFKDGSGGLSYWSGSGYFGLNTKTPTAALDVRGTISGSIISGSHVGDGSQLSGIVTETNFTQSLFVTPSGNNATAAVGDMMKPFATILGATGSANPGDTIIVYPGTYIEDRNLYKDGVNYHFIDGAKVVANSPVEPMWGGGTGQANGVGTSFDSPISITGHGEFY